MRRCFLTHYWTLAFFNGWAKLRYNWIPTELTESDFNEFIFPHITNGSRGPKPKISSLKMFNYFLYLMNTGCEILLLNDAHM